MRCIGCIALPVGGPWAAVSGVPRTATVPVVVLSAHLHLLTTTGRTSPPPAMRVGEPR